MVSQSTRTLGWWGLLPPIVAPAESPESDFTAQPVRYWLPLSDRAMAAISLAFSSDAPSDDQPSDAKVVLQRVKRALANDPPLLMYAMLTVPAGLAVSLTELAEWILMPEFAARFSDGEWMLAAPAILDRHQNRWSRLMARAANQSPTDWLDQVTDWLDVISPAVANDFSVEMPRLIWDGDDSMDAEASPDGSQLLHVLARAAEKGRSDRQRIESLAEHRKLSAAKQLAYGLSHEINNPLANISARAQSLAHDEADSRRRESLEQIVRQVFRAHEMIAGLMFYANPTEPDVEPFQLAEVVREAFDEFQSLAEEQGSRLLIELPGEPVSPPEQNRWSGDRMMILEAIRVLVRNALEAVGHDGTIVLSLQSEPDRWEIHVADSGPGLSTEASKHAFDPYYSGREAGRGLGLGLCRAYRIAELHGAAISLSGGLAGCVATITLPTQH
ncbi:sensor histidine kinase [Rhodopirellula sp. MGV]|uniref:sensor histidine kinase n=1 Tax=Rhodopirellula sp. MGV TaxID=2023130 RepID=UPI000B978608|nr:HAMP domain-containing sensor histidine kinase [Rhodopirellula sp. MGV]OYP30344.1 hypothetical protein CGZ80_22955 [Rhodopirellula sp. MGV]PNY34700.1 sensor histidine kinase [Rhodopirellula baltica]